jgi:hypothetical protein
MELGTMSETIEAAAGAPATVAVPELSIAFTAEEMVVLGRVLAETLAILGPSPLAAVAPKARDEVLASAARSLRARNVLTGPADLAAVDRAVAGLIQIAARPALRAELVVGYGARRHRRYLAIPYASVQHEVDDGLHRLTPFATSDLLARVMRDADFVERPVADVAGFDLPFGVLHQARSAVAAGDLEGARSVLRALGDDPVTDDPIDPADLDPRADDLPDEPIAPVVRSTSPSPAGTGAVPRESVERFVDALAAGAPVNAVRLVHTATPTRSVGGEVAWIDGGDAGLWQLPTIDQPFAVVGATDGDDSALLDPEHLDPERLDPALAQATVRVEPVAAADLASFLFDLLPSPSG